jgi:hypothetical protein
LGLVERTSVGRQADLVDHTEAMVMALRHERACSGGQLLGHRPDLLKGSGHPFDELVDLCEQ